MGNYPINKLESLPSIYIKQLKAFLDKQRKEKEAAERAAAEAAAKAELNNLPKTASDNWDDLKIKDPIANLLYNINPEYLQSQATVPTQASNYNNVPVTNNGFAFIKNFKYDPILVNTAVTEWKKNYIIKNQRTNIEAYIVSSPAAAAIDPFDSRAENIQNATTANDNAIYIAGSGDFPGTKGKYILTSPSTGTAPTKQVGDIYVQISPNYIFGAFSSTVSTNKGGPVLDVLAVPLREGQSIPDKDYSNWFDAVISFPNDQVIYFNRYPDTIPIEDRIKYKIGITYTGDKDSARSVFLKSDTQWKVKNTYSTGDKPGIILENETGGETYEIILGSVPGTTNITNLDLSFISNIILDGPNQDLAKNKVALQAEEIEKRVATQIQDIKNRYQIETDAKTLQALASSQSAIELMLRSISLYAISQQKPDVKLDDNFIKDLFSEGAYSKIFKKISGGELPTKKYKLSDFTTYIDGSMNASDRLEVNLRYGNSAYLMSAENVTSENVNLLEIIPQVELANLFKVKQLPYGEAADVLVDDAPKVSIYISLGLFLLMLNHCSMLYNTGKQGDTVVPMTYVDFNPSTNYYLSSINQFSIDPFSFIMPYYGNDTHYKKLFKPGIINSNNQIELKVSGSSIQPHSVFKFSNDRLSRGLLNNKIDINGKSDGYIGRTMDTLVNVNFLLKKIKDYSTSSDFGETYFQSILENITATLNKSTGYYNAFRLSYSDSANTYMIVDDQVQLKPDPKVKSLQYDIINPSTSTLAPEIPIQGKGSIARSFELRTDISNRISSMLAISTNPGAGTQVGMGKNMGDFGVYNIGSYDRYMPIKISESSSIAPQNNIQECQAAINFDTVVTTIYGLSSNQNKEILSNQQVQNAMAYYKERMARVKNEQPQSVSAMIIPIRTSITMDGFSGIYPFQLFTVNESVLPYRYSSANLNRGKVAFTTTKITHNFSNNEWITSMDGLMTFLKNTTDEQETAVIAPGPIEVNIVSAARITYTSIVANSKEIYDFFIAQGFTNFQAAAWVGNLNQESGLNPKQEQIGGGGGYGLAQWTIPSRKNPLITRPGYDTLQVQLDYIMEELNSASFSSIYKEIKATTDISSATLVIRTKYEMPKESLANDIGRLSYAEFIFEKFNKI
jgi:hypothetical protein